MKYAYVICLVHPTNKEPPSFAHTFVEAEDDEEAYVLGMRSPEIQAAQMEFPDRPFNDYVFPIGGES